MLLLERKIIVLDNIRSAYNVGSVFRTADAFGINEIYLCGITPMPVDKFGRERKDVSKVALGAQKNISWKYFSSSFRAVGILKKQGVKIYSIEQSDKSKNINKLCNMAGSNFAIVFGNEIKGISSKILDVSDYIFEIPMNGIKESLNISVVCGITCHILSDK